MTPNECIDLCTYIHRAVPAQQWAEGTPDVWWDLGLKDVQAADAKLAVQDMIRGRVFIDYTSIVEGVRKLRASRLAGVEDIQYPGDPDDVAAYIAWRRRLVKEVADGTYVSPPAPEVEQRDPPDLRRLMRRPEDPPPEDAG